MVPGFTLRFRAFGALFSLRPTWLVALFFLVGLTVTPSVAERQGHSWLLSWALLSGLLGCGLGLSIMLHEYGHSWAARRVGRTTHAVALFPFGGVPDGFDDPGTPRQEAIIAGGGPGVSLLVTAALLLLTTIIDESATVHDPLAVLLWGNAALALINVLPGYPFDGGRVFRALVWFLHDDYVTGTRAAVAYGQLISFLALMVGAYFLAADSNQSAIGLWILTLSWTASRLGHSERTRSFLIDKGADLSARETVIGLNPHVRVDQTIDEVLDVLLAEIDVGIALVMDGPQAVGVIGLDQIRRFRRATWRLNTARDAMIPIADLPQITDCATVREVLSQLSANGSRLILVAGRDGVIGALDQTTAIRSLYQRTHGQERRERPPA